MASLIMNIMLKLTSYVVSTLSYVASYIVLYLQAIIKKN